MPEVDLNDTLFDTRPGYAEPGIGNYRATPVIPDSPLPKPSYSDLWAASVRQENTLEQQINVLTTGRLQDEVDYGPVNLEHDPFPGIAGTKYEPYWERFMESRNEKHDAAIKLRLDQEIEDRKLIERSGAIEGFVLPTVASLLDLTTLIGAGPAAFGVTGRAARAAALTTAGRFAAANTAATIIQEGILQETQLARPQIESLFNIAMAAGLGGVLGGAASGISSGSARSIARQFRELGINPEDVLPTMRSGQSSTGAAQALQGEANFQGNLPPIQIAGRGVAKAAEIQSTYKLFGIELSGPMLRAFTLSSDIARDMASRMGDIGLFTTRNLEGIPTAPREGSLEIRNQRLVAYVGEALQSLRQQFLKHRYDMIKPGALRQAAGGIRDLAGAPAGKMTYRQFREAVAQAARRGDSHPIPEVAAAARQMRAQLFEPLGKMAVQARLLDQAILDAGTPKAKANVDGDEAIANQLADPEPVRPEDRTAVERLMENVEQTLGQEFPIAPGMRNQVIDAIARDRDLLQRIRSLMTDDGGPALAVDADTGRIIRLDRGDIGEDWSSFTSRLDEDETVEVSPVVVQTLKNEIMTVWEEMPPQVRGMQAMVLTKAERLADGRVRATFDDVWGLAPFTQVFDRAGFDVFRAAHVDGRLLIRASTIGNDFGGIPSRALMKGQIWHEFTHARLGSLDEAQSAALARVIDHGESLRILDQPLSDYSRKIGDTVWEENSPRTLRETYEEVYADYGDRDALMDEEVVAHIMELRSHGQLTPEELAPIEADLVELFGELPPVPAREGGPQLAIAGEPNMADGINQLIPPRNRALTKARDNQSATFAARYRLEQAAKSERAARRQAGTDLSLGLPLKISDDALDKVSRVLGELGGVRGLKIGAVSKLTPIGNGLVRLDIIGNIGSGRNVSEVATARIDDVLQAHTMISRDGRSAVVLKLAGQEEGDDAFRGQVAKMVVEGQLLRGGLSADVRQRLISHVEDLDPLSMPLGRYLEQSGVVASARFREMTLRDYYTRRFKDEPNLEDILNAKAVGHLAEDYSSGRMYAKDAARFLEDFAGLIPRRSMKDEVQLAISDIARRNDAIALDDIVPDENVPHPAKKILAFHGTSRDFDRFDPNKSEDIGMHFGTSSQAATRSGMRDGTRIIPVVLDIKNPLTIDELSGGYWDPADFYLQLRRLGVRFNAKETAILTSNDALDTLLELPVFDRNMFQTLRSALERAGYDGLRYLNEHEGDGWSYIVWNKDKVTSATTGKVMLAVGGMGHNRGPRDIGLKANGDHEDRIANRFPMQKQSYEDPFSENLIINQDAMRASPEAYAHNAKMIRSYVNWPKSNRVRNPDKVMEEFKTHLKDNLRWLYNMVPEARRAETREWYNGARLITDQWSEDFNQPPRVSAGILAALSPGKDWFANVSMGERMLDIWTYRQDFRWTDEMTKTANRVVNKEGKLLLNDEVVLQRIQNKTLAELIAAGDDLGAAAYIRIYDQTYHPGKLRQVTARGDFIGEPNQNINWQSYDNIAKAVRILMDPSKENISREMGQAHKIRNFYNNILAPNAPWGDVTIDTHAIAAALLRALAQSSMEVGHGLGSGTAKGIPNTKDVGITGSKGLYGVYADAYRELAEELGILPRELQSITWEAIRELFPRAWKRPDNVRAVDAIWQEVRDGKIQPDEARSRILSLRGGDEGFSFAERGGEGIDEPRYTSYEGELSAARISRRGPGRVPGRGGRGGDSRAAALQELGGRGLQNRGRRITYAIGRDLFGMEPEAAPNPRVDAAGFTSSVLEAASKLKSKAGPPGQLIGELENMGGVSKRELNYLNLRQRFHGQKRITRDELISAIEQDRVRLMVTNYTNETSGDIGLWISSDDELLGRLADEVMRDPEYWGRTRRGQGTASDLSMNFMARDREQTMNDIARLDDDDLEAFVREAFQRDPDLARDYPSLVGDAAPREPKWNDWSLDKDDPTYREDQISWPDDQMRSRFPRSVNFRGTRYQQHFDGENNIVHVRSSKATDQKGHRHHVVQEAQSDAGQGLRDVLNNVVAKLETGFEFNGLDQAGKADIIKTIGERGYTPGNSGTLVDDIKTKIRELGDEQMALSRTIADLESKMNDPDAAVRIQAIDDLFPHKTKFEALDRQIDELQELIREARAIPSDQETPGAVPFFESTDPWVNVGLRWSLMRAVDDGDDYISIATGDTVDSIRMGTPRTGAIGYYDGIAKKNMRNILQKIDKEAAKPVFVPYLNSDSGRRIGTGSNKRYRLHEYNGQYQLLEDRRVMRDWDGNEIDHDNIGDYGPDELQAGEWDTPRIIERFDDEEQAKRELARYAGTEGGFWSFPITDKVKRIVKNDRLPALAVAERPEVATGDAHKAALRERAIKDLMNDLQARAMGLDEEFAPPIAQAIWANEGKTSYLTRIWNKVEIERNSHKFIDMTMEYFKSAQNRARVVLEKMEKELEGTTPNAMQARNLQMLRQFVDAEDVELKDWATQVKNHIIGAKTGPNQAMIGDLPPGLRGPLKARTFKIPDTFQASDGTKVEDFLENDMGRIAQYYAQTVGPQINMMRMFGSLDMAEQIQKIIDDYDRIINRVARADPNDRKALKTQQNLQQKYENEKKEAIQLMQAMRDRLLGIYGLPKDPTDIGPRAARMAKLFNVITKMGGMVVSSLPDLARPIMTQGILDSFRSGYMPLINFVGNRKLLKMTKEDIQLTGAAWENSMPRFRELGDVQEEFGSTSRFERGMDAFTDAFGKFSGMNMWNEKLKLMTGRVVMAKIIQASERVLNGTATKADLVKLAKSNLWADEAEIIAEQFRKHGASSGGLYAPNTKEWDVNDPIRGRRISSALESFRAAINREVNQTIVTPGLNRPNWLDTTYGSLIGQFKSFLFAAQELVLLKGLQQRDAGVLFGLIAMIGMGMVVTALKAWGSDREPPKNLQGWIINGIDRSGVTGWLFEINNLLEKGTRGQFGLSMLTGEDISRFEGRNAVSSLLGPTLGTTADVFTATGSMSEAIAKGDPSAMSAADVYSIRRLAPLQNLFYLQWLFNQGQDAARESFGIPDTRNKGRFEWEQIPRGLGTVERETSDAGGSTNVASADVPRETSAAPVQVAEAPQAPENESTRRVTRSPGTIPTVA